MTQESRGERELARQGQTRESVSHWVNTGQLRKIPLGSENMEAGAGTAGTTSERAEVVL